MFNIGVVKLLDLKSKLQEDYHIEILHGTPGVPSNKFLL
jgi:hypothetical protein